MKTIEEKIEEENEKIRKRDWRVSPEKKPQEGGNVKIIDSGLHLFLFSLFHFIFSLPFNFYFLFLEQLGLGLSVTLSHQSQVDGIVMRLITRLRRRE